MEEILALDMLTLPAHTLAAGDVFTQESHRTALAKVLPKSKIIKIHRGAQLAAYAYLWPKGSGLWFMGGFALHPDVRFGRMITQLIAEVENFVAEAGIIELQSHVYKTNQRSLALHRRLGFQVINENKKGLAFSLKPGGQARSLSFLGS